MGGRNRPRTGVPVAKRGQDLTAVRFIYEISRSGFWEGAMPNLAVGLYTRVLVVGCITLKIASTCRD